MKPSLGFLRCQPELLRLSNTTVISRADEREEEEEQNPVGLSAASSSWWLAGSGERARRATGASLRAAATSCLSVNVARASLFSFVVIDEERLM